MKQRMTMKLMVAFCAVSATVNVMADAPVIGDVTVRQRWPWSRLVDIDYVLTSEVGQKADVTVTGYNGATALDIQPEAFSGDLYNVEQGFRRIVFDPAKTAYTNQPITRFRVNLEPVVSPLYMIVDLTKESGTSNQVVYLTEAGLSSGAYGSVETNPVNGVESIIWTGVTNDASYMTTKLVLRRVPAGTFMMGEDAGAKSVTLTKDFYIGVFEMTQEQWYRINSSWPSCYFTNSVEKNMRPVEYESSYHAIRGSNVGTNWPGSAGVDNNSIIGKLRSKTKIVTFDLPTEAQWEYACRAGTITYYNDGLGTPANTSSNAQMDVLGRYRYNGGYINGAEPSRNVGVTNGTAAVGGYRPNAWGLYDMHGNLWEWCLDWSSSLQGGTDPAGGVTGTARVLRGGSWNASSGTVCRSAFRNGTDPTSQNIGFGFRLVVTLP